MNKQQELLERAQNEINTMRIDVPGEFAVMEYQTAHDLIAEIKRLDGHMERLGDEGDFFISDYARPDEWNHTNEFEARIQYAVDNRYPPLTGEDR